MQIWASTRELHTRSRNTGPRENILRLPAGHRRRLGWHALILRRAWFASRHVSMSRKLSRNVSCANASHRNWSRHENPRSRLSPSYRRTHVLNSCRGKNSLSCEKTICPDNIRHPPPARPRRKGSIVTSGVEIVRAPDSTQASRMTECFNQSRSHEPDSCGNPRHKIWPHTSNPTAHPLTG